MASFGWLWKNMTKGSLGLKDCRLPVFCGWGNLRKTMIRKFPRYMNLLAWHHYPLHAASYVSAEWPEEVNRMMSQATPNVLCVHAGLYSEFGITTGRTLERLGCEKSTLKISRSHFSHWDTWYMDPKHMEWMSQEVGEIADVLLFLM